MTSPFDWKNGKSEIDWVKLKQVANSSAVSTATIERKRAKGIEPSMSSPMTEHTAHINLDPKKFVTKRGKT